eukprot:jgi/Tetstr1/443496/TSEL_031501.t1
MQGGGFFRSGIAEQGFSGVGKLKGKEHRLYRAGIFSLCEALIEGVNCDTPTYPHLSDLSAHHRMKLLPDISIGLLCKHTPLPPDTPEHHSAFFAVTDYVVEQ